MECLDGPDGCEGEVQLTTVDGLKYWPRCTKHFEDRLDKQAHINELLSDTPPDWFDPLAAGERWDDDY